MSDTVRDTFDDDEGCGTDETVALAAVNGPDAARLGLPSDGRADGDLPIEADAAPVMRATADGVDSAETSIESSAALMDAVRIEIRRGEVVITIRADAIGAGTAAAAPRIETRWAPAAEAPLAGGAPSGRVATMARAATTRAAAVLPFVGLANVPADKYGDGYNYFRMRADLTDSYRAAYRQVKALGGLLTSSGGIRDLGERATAGRSRTSLHYTGRAIDLFIYTGMQGGTEPFLVARNGGTDNNPEWKVYCVSRTPIVEDPLYDASLIKEGEIECVRWQRGVGYKTQRRRERYFSLTDVLARHGWLPIPARSDWRTQYLSCEWWHFQNEKGLVVGSSTFGDQLRQVWPADKVRASGLALAAKWAGRSFRVGQVPTVVAPAPLPNVDPQEKIYWAQVVLNTTAGEALATDGDGGPRTRGALHRFQSTFGLQPSGELDASTEVALVQRALGRLLGESFPRIGVLDDGTVSAIMRFQRAGSLNPDGRAGPKTRAALVTALGGAPFTPAAPLVATSATPRPATVGGRPTRGRAAARDRVSLSSVQQQARRPARAAASADAAGDTRREPSPRRRRSAAKRERGETSDSHRQFGV